MGFKEEITMKELTICQRCILPRSYKAVRFNEDGICSLCRDHASRAKKEQAELKERAVQLEKIVAGVKNTEGPYDCIVPVSGGWDSAYAAWVMRREFKLHILGLNVDNGYRTPLALTNLEKISRNLEMDIVTLKLNANLLHRLYGHFFRTCGYFCTVCNAVGYLTAGSFVAYESKRLKRKIPVIGGWSKKYEFQPGLSTLSMKAFDSILRLDEDLYHELRNNPLVKPSIFDAFMSLKDVRQGGTDHGILQLPDYMDWDYRRIAKVLKVEVGMEEPGIDREHHYDCFLHPLQQYLKYRKFGFDQESIRCSVLIRENRMTRDEALRRIDKVQKTEPPVLQEVLKQWNMTREDVNWEADWERLW
jgi:hypothetical protein